MDDISKRIVSILEKSKEPLETKEIENKMTDVTRTKILSRLKDLAVTSKVRGKRVGAGTKGVWIWWK